MKFGQFMYYYKIKLFIRKNIFACLFSVHNTIILSRHEQVLSKKSAKDGAWKLVSDPF